MRVLGPVFVPDRHGRSSLDALDQALHDMQHDGCRTAALAVETPAGETYVYVSPRLTARRRQALLDAIRQQLTTEQ